MKAGRSPIVVVLGHIDHGKTTLLDKIRKTSVAEKESGGITQHIGAYEIEVRLPREVELREGKITFIDTPGHEAFQKMRSRGAKVADIALLVVAADDGVKPQTEEALRAIREAKIPFIVVLNKIDKDTADPERVKKELGEREVYLEEWGGKVPLCKISAKTGEGLEELLELILLVAQLEDLKADFSSPASGVVIESALDPKRGNAATLLPREGVLREGEWVLAGETRVKIKIMEDAGGQSVKEARAGQAVRVVGFDKIPQVGSAFRVFRTKEELEETWEKKEGVLGPVTAGAVGKKEFIIPVILKADTAGSLEALEHELKKFENDFLGLNFIRAGVGKIGEDDLKLASASGQTLVLGFKVKIEKGAIELAERFGISLKSFEVIYELGDWVREEIERRLPAEKERKVLGRGRILKIFKETGQKRVVGGKMESGLVTEGKKFSLLRRDFPLGEGKILELQAARIKVKEVLAENEFGALVEIGVEVSPGDVLEIFEEEIKKKKLG